MSQVVDPLDTLRPRREDDLDQRRPPAPSGSAPLAYDVFREGNDLVIEFDAPGVEPSAIEVALEGRTVVVTLQRTQRRGPSIDVIEGGRQHGTFRQRLWLGDRWDLDGLRARAHNGVLTVRAPLAPEVVRRRVTVSAASAEPVPTSDVATTWGELFDAAGGAVAVEGMAESAA